MQCSAPACDKIIGYFGGYKGGEIYWLAIHSNQANLIVGGLRLS
jgi:hypothetical protein